MSKKKQGVSEAACQVLSKATIEGNQLKLHSGDLEHGLYREVDWVLSKLGGQWKGGKIAAHVFPVADIQKLRETLDLVTRTGYLPPAGSPTIEEGTVRAKEVTQTEGALSKYIATPMCMRLIIRTKIGEITLTLDDVLFMGMIGSHERVNYAHDESDKNIPDKVTCEVEDGAVIRTIVEKDGIEMDETD